MSSTLEMYQSLMGPFKRPIKIRVRLRNVQYVIVCQFRSRLNILALVFTSNEKKSGAIHSEQDGGGEEEVYNRLISEQRSCRETDGEQEGERG